MNLFFFYVRHPSLRTQSTSAMTFLKSYKVASLTSERISAVKPLCECRRCLPGQTQEWSSMHLINIAIIERKVFWSASIAHLMDLDLKWPSIINLSAHVVYH